MKPEFWALLVSSLLCLGTLVWLTFYQRRMVALRDEVLALNEHGRQEMLKCAASLAEHAHLRDLLLRLAETEMEAEKQPPWGGGHAAAEIRAHHTLARDAVYAAARKMLPPRPRGLAPGEAGQ